jgi:glucokinase
MAYFAIGVDLGGTNLRIAAVDEGGTILEIITTSTEVARGRDNVITEMTDAIRSIAGKHQARGTMSGVGIGVPGIIDKRTGMLRESPNLPGWSEYPVREEIERRLGSRVILENDANAAALGEFWLGAGKDVSDLCMLTLGTGVGGGIILNGQIWEGMNGMAGELGHIPSIPDGHPCGCGSRGCVEQYASATAIKRMALDMIADGRAPELARAMARDKEVTAKRVFELARDGDAPAQEIFNKVGEGLGVVVAGLINALNLPMYVIGGGVSAGWDAFSPRMIEVVRKRSFVYAATSPGGGTKPETIITRARLGGDAGILGAARLPMLLNHR